MSILLKTKKLVQKQNNTEFSHLLNTETLLTFLPLLRISGNLMYIMDKMPKKTLKNVCTIITATFCNTFVQYLL